MEKRRKTTINDIAREAGVSRSLVSSVLTNMQQGKKIYRVSEETTLKVQKIMDLHDYRPSYSARALRSGNNRIIGVVLSDISNRFFAVVSRSVEECAREHGYMVMFGNTDDNPDNLAAVLDLFYEKDVSGLIVVPCVGSEEAILRYRNKGLPTVLLERDFPGSGLSSVLLDNRKASAQLTGSLLKDGHKKVEFVSYDTTMQTILEREKGYKDEMVQHGLDNNIRVHKPRYCNYDDIQALILDAISRKVEALVFATYRMALLGRQATLRNSITAPCAFACFNNADTFDIYEKSMYYVKQPIDDFARYSVELLVGELEGAQKEEGGTKIVLPPQIEKTQ